MGRWSGRGAFRRRQARRSATPGGHPPIGMAGPPPDRANHSQATFFAARLRGVDLASSEIVMLLPSARRVPFRRTCSPASFAKSANSWLEISQTLPCLTKTYFEPAFTQAAVHSAGLPGILCFAPHIESEISP